MLSHKFECMRLLSENFLIKPLCAFELESLIDSLETGSEFELAKINPNQISKDLKLALEETILPEVNKHPHDYLLHTIWIIILKESLSLVGFFSFSQPTSDKRKIDLSLSVFDEYKETNQIQEAIYIILQWLGIQQLYNKIQFYNELDLDLNSVFEKNDFIPMTNNLFVKKL